MRFNVIFRKLDKKLPVVFGHNDNSFAAVFKGIQTVTARPDAEYYEGAYEVTPQRVDQALQTSGKLLTADVIVKAIPKEYGLVSYDQNKAITVS